MQEGKAHREEVESIFNHVKEIILVPLFSRFNSFTCQPITQFISTNDKFSCYTELFHLFTYHHQTDDNYQEYIYNQVVTALQTYYEQFLHISYLLKEGDEVVDNIACKWKEMDYIKSVMNTVFLYVEKNYVTRTEKDSINKVIMNCFYKCIFCPLKDILIHSIREAIRSSRFHKLSSFSPNYHDAVHIVIECLREYNGNVSTEFEDHIIFDTFNSYKHKQINISSLPSVLKDLDSYCTQEKAISEFFGIEYLCARMQDTMITCLLDKKFAQLLHLHMDSLFPNDLITLEQVYDYAIRLENGVEEMANELKRVFIKLGMAIFSTYEQRIRLSSDPRKLNREYISLLSKHFYHHYQIITEKLHGVSLFYQSLYSSMAIVTDHCLNSECSIPSGLADYIDYRIRKNMAITAEFSKELDELIFLYANLNNKDEFINRYNILLSRRLLYLSNYNYDTERNVISKIRASAGILSVSTMDSILNDIATDSSQVFYQKLSGLLSHLDYNFKLNVLTKGIWPSLPESEYEDSKHSSGILCPPEMNVILDEFTKIDIDSERNFAWSFVRGYCNVAITLGNQNEVLIQMLPIQYIVLSLFNGDIQLSFEEIQKKTNIGTSLLKQVLVSFVFSKVNLIKKVTGASRGISESDVFTFNDTFTTPHKSIRMNALSEERKSEIEQNVIVKYTESYKACIVSYVKKNKAVPYKDLMKYTLEKMKSWNMDKDDFVKCVDSLIESEYIERNENNNNIIQYA